MALIERLMKTSDAGVPGEHRPDGIASHLFFAVMAGLSSGQITTAEAKAGLEIRKTIDDSGTSDEADFDAIAAQIPGPLLPAEKAVYSESIHAILLLAEEMFPGYTDPAKVRAKLGI